MASTIDQAFVKQYEADVHLAYQQMGSKLRNTVRTKSGVTGSTLRFQKVGKGTASTKTRNGDIPLMEAVHSYVDVTLADYYAGDYIDRLDEYKTNIDERKVILDTSAGAIGRKMDDLLITAAYLTTTTQGTGAASDYTGSNASDNALKQIKKAISALNVNEAPDDGQRFCIVSPQVWDLLLDVDKFARSEYIGTDLPFLKGTEARKFMNVNFLMHTGLTISGSGSAQFSKCLVYHKSALGLGEAEFLKSDIWWDGRKASHFINNCMSAGSALVDVNGCVLVNINNGL